MATVTGLTAERMLEIEAASVVDGTIDGDGHLILIRQDESEIDAGSALAAIPDASTTQKGAVELATDAEVVTGTDTTRAVTPAGLANSIVDASTTQKGVVELATDTETSTGTDTDRAVTPAGLAPVISDLDSRIDVLEAQTGEKIQLLSANAFDEADVGTDYPVGISMMSLGSGAWATFSGLGWVITYHRDNSRLYQEFHRHQINDYWMRTYNFQVGWSDWTPVHGNVVVSQVTVNPTANTPTSTTWNYGKTLVSPRTFATMHSAVPGSTVIAVATSSATSTSVSVWVYRTNATATLVNVMAVGS